jgi:hypothetical protein
MSEPLPKATVERLSSHVGEHGIRATSRKLGLAEATIRKVLGGRPVTSDVAGKLACLSARPRQEKDYGKTPEVKPPRAKTDAYSWDLESIVSARTAQLDGKFERPHSLSVALTTCGEISIARRARCKALTAVATKLVPHGGARGRAVMKRAAAGCSVTPEVIADLLLCLVDHAIAFGYVRQTTLPDASGVDFALTYWPIEHVEHDKQRDVIRTRTEADGWQDIVHGDGRWIIFRKSDRRPWQTDDACLLSSCLVWAGIAEGNADWTSSIRAHGLARILATLPPEEPTRDKDGITPAVNALMTMLTDLLSGDSPVGILPGGVTAKFEANPSNAWQVFDTFGANRGRLAARIYTGSDAILGQANDAPGSDLSKLFNVASTLTADDAKAICSGLDVGFYQPWTALNTGSTQYAPSFEFVLPDPDLDRSRLETATGYERLAAALARMREQKLEVTQGVVDLLAVTLGVSPAPILATEPGASTSVVLAPTDLVKILRVGVALKSLGLDPFGDDRDNMTVAAFDALATAEVKAQIAIKYPEPAPATKAPAA